MRFALLLTLFVATSCPAATYYVRDDGNDRASGTSHSAAWATLERVNGQSFAAGDVVLFHEGDRWQGKLGVDWSGTPSAHATVGAYYVENGTAKKELAGSDPSSKAPAGIRPAGSTTR